jgi:DNA-binding CsgD family transcriptional regulator
MMSDRATAKCAADLNKNQRRLLGLLLCGRTQKQVADIEGGNASSISTRIKRIKVKLGLRTMVQLGAWCERHGIREAGAG